MKTVLVTYTVDASFAETNAANIRNVMSALRELADDGIRYQVFRQQDGATFVHFAMLRDEAAQQRLTTLPAFKTFQEQLGASKPTTPPNATPLDLIGSSYEIFE